MVSLIIRKIIMKKLLNFLILGIVLALFTNASCTGPDPPIPTGNHTFSCRINGKLFLPNGSTDLSTAPFNDGLFFYRYNQDNDFAPIAYNSPTKVNFYIKNFTLGTFSLDDSNGNIEYPYSDPIKQATVFYNGKKYLSKQGSGSVTFTIVTGTDSKGTFEFTLYNENNSNDVLHITNGQFDD